MKRIILQSIFILALINNMLGQNTYKITNFPSHEAIININFVCTEDTIVWAATNFGIYKMTRNGTVLDFFNTENSGLIDNEVTCISIDSDNNKWFGTSRKGISKFDGYKWTNFNVSNSLIINNEINTIKIVSDSVWIGTNSGLSRFYNGQWFNYNASNTGVPLNKVLSIAIDNSNNPWVGINDFGVVWFDGFRWQEHLIGTVQNPMDVTSIAIDKYNNKWLATSYDGLYKYDNANWTQPNSGLYSNYLNSISIDSSDTIWVAGRDFVAKKHVNSSSFSHLVNSVIGLGSGSTNQLKTCFTDQTSIRWFATNIGVMKYSKGKYSLIFNTSSKPSMLRGILVDLENNIWVLNSFNRYSVYKNSQWYLDSIATINPYTSLKKLGMDSQGNIWITSEANGVFKYNSQSKSWQNFTTVNGLINNSINDITIDKQGKIWFATSAGISSFNGTIWTNYNNANSGLINNSVLSIKCDNSGNMWAGTRTGIAKLNGSNWNTASTLEMVMTIEPDLSGNIYLWSSTTGLYKYNGATFITMSEVNGISSRSYQYIKCDVNNNIWFGNYTSTYNAKGIAKFDGTNYINYTTGNAGIISDLLTGIYIDHLNNKWILSENGISKLSCTAPIPDFNFTAACTGDVSFTNSSTNIDFLSKYSWDFGYDGTIDTIQENVVKKYPSSGNYYVSMIVDNDNCTNNVLKSISIKPLPIKPTLEINKNQLCIGDTILCTNNDPLQNYQWKFNSQIVESPFDDIFIVKESKEGDMVLKTIDINGCSNESDTVKIELFNSVNPEIAIKFDNVLVCNNTGNLYTDYQWFADDLIIEGAIKQFYTATNMQLNYSVIARNNNNCLVKSDNFTLKNLAMFNIYPNPTHSFLNLQFSGESIGQINVTIFNQLGSPIKKYQLYKSSFDFNQQISLQGLGKGQYILQYQIGDKKENKVLSIE